MKKFLSAVFSGVLVFVALFSFACSKDSAKIKYSNPKTIMQDLIADELDFGLLPEPALSNLEKSVGKDFTWERIDLQELYNKQTKAYPQAVLMVKNSVLNDCPELVDKLKTEISSANDYVKANKESVINSIRAKFSASSLVASISDSSIDNCKIYWEDALNSKNTVKTYLKNIIDIGVGLGIQPAKSVEDDFFYTPIAPKGQDYSNKNFTFTVPDGAPALAIGRLIENPDSLGANSLTVNVVDSNSIALAFDNSDFIIAPINLASKKYTGKYTMVSVVTHGNLYLVKKAGTDSKLSGKKIGVIGEGLVPDLTLRSILKKQAIKVEVIS